MDNQLVTSLTAVYEKLTNFSGLEEFWNRLDTIFGSEYNQSLAQMLQSQWRNQDFSHLPQVEIVSSEVLGSARGAYAAQQFQIQNVVQDTKVLKCLRSRGFVSICGISVMLYLVIDQVCLQVADSPRG
jgi:hypothetical protein